MPEIEKSYLERALEDGHARITGDGKAQRIHYVAANRFERWADPEEKVRAARDSDAFALS